MRDSERVDIIVESDAELAREEMRDIIFAQMKLGFEHFKRKLLRKMLGAVADDLANCARIARSRRGKAHHRQKLAEKRQKTSADDRVAVKVAARVAVSREAKESVRQRIYLGIQTRALDQGRGRNARIEDR